ncbi:MAG: SMC-Scp complex subunit ScpB [Clostridia bacterium]|nr:SMC-Scp complex subunit ScpB [Clostridia bacterium]
MTDEELVSCLEALLFASGRPVDTRTLENLLEVDSKRIPELANMLKEKLENNNSGIKLIEINNGYQLSTDEKYYEQVCKLLDNRPKPSLSQAAMEVLAIMAYNPKITRAEIEKIRGVSSDSAINKLLEYGLIEEAGRIDAPGRPMTFKTSEEFLRLFGYKSLSDMPELPKLAEEDPQIMLEGMDEEENEEISGDSVEDKQEDVEDNKDLVDNDTDSTEETIADSTDISN